MSDRRPLSHTCSCYAFPWDSISSLRLSVTNRTYLLHLLKQKPNIKKSCWTCATSDPNQSFQLHKRIKRPLNHNNGTFLFMSQCMFVFLSFLLKAEHMSQDICHHHHSTKTKHWTQIIINNSINK